MNGIKSIGHCTRPYAEYLLNLLVNSTIQDVAQQETISYKRIINIIKQHIPHKIDWPTIDTLKTLGIDEISLKKDSPRFFIEYSQSLIEDGNGSM